MFSSRFGPKVASAVRAFSTTTASNRKVAVLGAAGGIGQPLALLAKQSQLVSKLSVYDVVHAKGVAADLSHISTPAQVSGYVGDEELGAAIADSDLIIIPAGVPRKPGMTRDDLFNTNASIVQTLSAAIAIHAPNAVIGIISNPVNSTVAIAAETLKAAGVYDPRKLFGVTTLDVVRARTFVAEAKGVDINTINVPVVGGHAGATILPLLSQSNPSIDFSAQEIEDLTVRIQNGGTEVVEAKAGAGSATLSMAMAGWEFGEAVLNAMNGKAQDIYTMVENDKTPCKYFALRVTLGPDGVAAIHDDEIKNANEYESNKLTSEVYPELAKSIEKGEDFANSN